jgi:GNAT superfamily N-acetyltransferase
MQTPDDSRANRGFTLQVREVRDGDVRHVVTLVTDVLAEFGLRFGAGSTTDDEVTQLPGSYADRGGAFWVATDEAGLILGTCGAFPVAPSVYELRKMYLLPAARGRGAGRQLLDACVAWTRARGALRLVLDTTEQMDRAIAFYEKHGFVRDDAQIRGARCSRGYALDLRRG